MRKFYYTVEDPEFDDYFEWNHPYDHEGYDDIIEDCAKEYQDNSNWENESQLDFYLWKRDEPDDEPELLGVYTVYREWEPYFHAYEKK